MMNYPNDLRYSKEHQWIRVEGNRGKVGITDYAQSSLGDIIFVELPQEGDELKKDDALGIVESAKSSSDVYCPVSGKVIAVNEELLDSPQLINEDPYGRGWMIEIELSDPSELDDLMEAAEYRAMVEEEKGD
ncbi:MAG: glycine cleavage system protein [Clostridia bacterium]|nr:glycine cleavage system protein [Clostridia bacterium]